MKYIVSGDFPVIKELHSFEPGQMEIPFIGKCV